MKIKHLIIVFLVTCCLPLIHGQNRIKIVFRYDDFLLQSSAFSDSVLNIFIKNKIPVCLGIIPFDTNNVIINQFADEKINDLKSKINKGEIEVALHGYNHLNHLVIPRFEKVSYSEFATVSPDIQREMLSKGKRTLDSLLQINTCIFVPPFNTYDINTVKILEELNFEIISGSLSGPTYSNSIKYMPATYEDFSELREIINKSENETATIVLYFHPYSFQEVTSKRTRELTKLMTIRKLDTILNWVKTKNVSFYTFSSLAETEDFSESLLLANSMKFNFLKKTLNKFKLYKYGVYLPLDYLKSHKSLFYANILLHFLSFIFVYFFIYFLTKLFRPNIKTISVIIGIISLLILIFLLKVRNDFSFWIFLILTLVNYAALISGLLRFHLSISRSSLSLTLK